jgi:hypothetical protein
MALLWEHQAALAYHFGLQKRCGVCGNRFYDVFALDRIPATQKACHWCRNQLKPNVVQNGWKSDFFGDGAHADLLETLIA